MGGVGLARKLRLKPGLRVCFLDPTPESVAVIREELPPGMEEAPCCGEDPVDMIFFWPWGQEGLAARFSELRSRILPNKAVWVVIPKKPPPAPWVWIFPGRRSWRRLWIRRWWTTRWPRSATANMPPALSSARRCETHRAHPVKGQPGSHGRRAKAND